MSELHIEVPKRKPLSEKQKEALETVRQGEKEMDEFWEAYSGQKRKPWKKLDRIKAKIAKAQKIVSRD